MSDMMSLGLVAATALAGVIVLAVAGLRAWHEWVELQRYMLSGGKRDDKGSPASPSAARIELADLKERVRKLEAIAAGVDL